MASRGKELLTADQRAEFVQIPADMTERELETYYTFSQFDLEIIKRHRRSLTNISRKTYATQNSKSKFIGFYALRH